MRAPANDAHCPTLYFVDDTTGRAQGRERLREGELATKGCLLAWGCRGDDVRKERWGEKWTGPALDGYPVVSKLLFNGSS